MPFCSLKALEAEARHAQGSVFDSFLPCNPEGESMPHFVDELESQGREVARSSHKPTLNEGWSRNEGEGMNILQQCLALKVEGKVHS